MAQTRGEAGRGEGERLAHELNGPGLAESAVYERLAAFESAFNHVEDPPRREAELLALFDPAVVVHGMAAGPVGLDALRTELARLWTAIPDLVLHHDAVLSAWSMGAVRWRGTGSRRARYLGAPADWRPVRMQGESIMRFGPDGRIVEWWLYRRPLRDLEATSIAAH
jgi:predicted ester cyclase